MICLNNTDTLEGGASVNAVVDYTVHGLVDSTFTQLAAGQLSNTDPSVLYTAGAAISVVSITLVNTHTAAVTVNLYLDPANIGTPRRMIPKNVSLGIGYALVYDGQRFSVMNAAGEVLQTGNLHGPNHQNGGSDEINVVGLSGLLADDQHVLDSEVINLVYPVGSIYVSTVSTNPGTLFGVGTWAAFGAGRVLVGLDAGQTEFDVVEETGGAKTHVLIEAEMPAHTHSTEVNKAGAGGGANQQWVPTDDGVLAQNQQWPTNSKGSGSAHNNLQPYIVVYMWKRTA